MTTPSIDAIRHVTQECSGSNTTRSSIWSIMRRAFDPSSFSDEEIAKISAEAKEIVEKAHERVETLKKDLRENRK